MLKKRSIGVTILGCLLIIIGLFKVFIFLQVERTLDVSRQEQQRIQKQAEQQLEERRETKIKRIEEQPNSFSLIISHFLESTSFIVSDVPEVLIGAFMIGAIKSALRYLCWLIFALSMGYNLICGVGILYLRKYARMMLIGGFFLLTPILFLVMISGLPGFVGAIFLFFLVFNISIVIFLIRPSVKKQFI